MPKFHVLQVLPHVEDDHWNARHLLEAHVVADLDESQTNKDDSYNLKNFDDRLANVSPLTPHDIIQSIISAWCLSAEFVQQLLLEQEWPMCTNSRMHVIL